MAARYSRAQRKQYLEMADNIGRNWMDVFQGDTDFYSAAYWDLLTEIWRADKPVRKTDALRYMKAIYSIIGFRTTSINTEQALPNDEDFRERFRTSLVAITSYTTFLRSSMLLIFLGSFLFLMRVIAQAP